MAELVVGRFRPQAGQAPENLELPGPGLYEADFNVPGWMVPDIDVDKEFTLPVGEHLFHHKRTQIQGDVLTVRFQITDRPVEASAPPRTEGVVLFLTVGSIVTAWFVGLGWIGDKLLGRVAENLIEVRKLFQTPAGAASGLATAALALAGAFVLFKKG